MNLWSFFMGVVFVAFGLGVFLTQSIGESIQSGLIYLGIGFTFLIFSIISKRHNEVF